MFILQALYFFLPAYLANMAPVFAAKVFGRRFTNPIDGKRTYRGKRIFGNHKTWRGLISGIIVAILTVYIQRLVANTGFGLRLSLLDYSEISPLILGFLFGFGALAGDAVKSFFKRQRNLPPGAKWPVFDQLDFVIGGLLMATIVIVIPLRLIIVLLVISPLLHLSANWIGYRLKLKNNPW